MTGPGSQILTSSSSGETRRMKPPPELPVSCVGSRPLDGRQVVAGGYIICRAVCAVSVLVGHGS